jgi:4-amino-4-deoxy-L-arabinose transferase-like glycosyltransferase
MLFVFPPARRRARRLAPWLLAAATLALLLTGLGSHGIVGGDEAVYHHIAREMLADGDYLRLDSSGLFSPREEFRNAPFHYWVRAGLIELLGDNAWSMRLLSAAGGAATVAATWTLGGALGGTAVALLAGFIQLTSFNFLWLHGARTGELDALATAAVTLAVWGFLRALRRERSFFLHHAALALLFNLKAPLALPLIAADLALLALARDRELALAWLRTGLVVAPFAATWHLARLVVLGERAVGLFNELAYYGWQRSERIAGVTGASSAAYYVRVMASAAWPWGIAWVAAFPVALHARFADRRARLEGLVPVVYASIFFAFFVLLAKQNVWYMTPIGPLLAVGTAEGFVRLLRGEGSRLRLAAAATLALLPLAVRTPFPPPSPLRAGAQAYDLDLMFGPGTDPAFFLAFAPLLVGAAAAFRPALARPQRATLLIAGAALATLAMTAGLRVTWPLGDTGYQRPVEVLAATIREDLEAGRTIGLPLRIPTKQGKLAAFLFADRFEICRRRSGASTALFLYPKGAARRCLADRGLPWSVSASRTVPGPPRD